MARLLTLVALFLLSVSQTVVGLSSCLAADSNFNLYAFGLNGKDYNIGTQDKWTGSNKATDITITGRPPFDGANTTCFLSQFQNAIYVVGGDTQNPDSVYIYNAATPAWSQQTTTPGGYDITSAAMILDHDTNVFYSFSKGEMWFLNMQSLKSAQSSAIAWTDVGPTPYGSTYEPVMALANNHIHFLDVPGAPTGDADIFVIHFSYFQPQPQAYPLPSGTMPATHGQTASIFQPTLIQQEFAFIPDDDSATYVVNVINNNTQQLAGPTTKDPKATYFATVTAICQLTSNGAVSFLPYIQGNDAANLAASWTTVSALSVVAPPTSSSSSSTGSTAASSATGSTPTSAQGGTSSNRASSMRNVSRGLSVAFVLAGMACIL